jgi:dUTP pyrophosphatase
MMRSLLNGANLSPQYWSWAILHALYLKNRIPHRALNTTPYEAYIGRKPNHLRVFGSPVTVRNPGRQPAKLDTHASLGTFLGYTATHNNIYYLDSHTKHIKISTHVVFDDAGYTIPSANHTNLQRQIQQQGVHQGRSDDVHQEVSPGTTHDSSIQMPDDAAVDAQHDVIEGMQRGTLEPINIVSPPDEMILFTKLSDKAIKPTRATTEAAGYDIFSATRVILPPHVTTKVPTDLAMQPPINTSRSGLVINHGVETKGGTIDRDYTGNVVVLLHNNTDKPCTVEQGDRTKLHNL